MDPWVVSNVLQPNLEHTGFVDASVIHTARVENFLERADKLVGMSSLEDVKQLSSSLLIITCELQL